jgi:hypothetical protein
LDQLTLCIENNRLLKPIIESVEATQLIEMVEAALTGLQDWERTNNTLLADINTRDQHAHEILYIPDSTPTLEGIKKIDLIGVNRGVVAEFNKAAAFTQIILPGWIGHQNQVLTEMRQGKVAPQHFFSYVDLEIHRRSSWCAAHPYAVTCAYSFLGKICAGCQQVIAIQHWTKHKESLKCIQAGEEQDLRSKQWEPTWKPHHWQAIRKAGLPHKLQATEYAVWVPPLVSSAIRLFESTPRGYGGMSLEEFLTKLYVDSPT